MDDFDRLLERERDALSTYNHFSIGKTEWGQEIYCFALGEGKRSILLQGAMHAREYISSFVLFDMMEYLSHFYLPVKVYFIPIVNKDGVALCIKGNKLKNVKNHEKAQKNIDFFKNLGEKDIKIVKKLLNRYDVSFLKSNGKGVDLNVNFDCDWGGGRHNFFAFPSLENYVGTAPCNAKENKSLISFTKKIMPSVTLSFHSKGEVFYYGYMGESREVRKKDKIYRYIIHKSTGYKAVYTRHSTGGYKDWCVISLSIPSFTIELGEDSLSHPISSHHCHEIFAKVKSLVLDLSKELV